MIAGSIAPDDLRTFLAALWEPGDVREVRIPKHDGRHVAAGWFDDPERLAAAVAAWDGKANIYVTLNPVDRSLLALAPNLFDRDAKTATADLDILARRWLLVDVDPARKSGISATDAESEAAHDVATRVWSYLAGNGWPAPIAAMSGNGYALFYRVDLPNDPASTALVAGVLKHLAERFDVPGKVAIDTTVSNASRIGCLVGTMKVKGYDMPDRPHRRSGIKRMPERLDVVPVDLLAALVPPAVPKKPTNGEASGLDHGWVREWLDRAGIAYREKPGTGITWYHLDDCPFHSGEDIEGRCAVGERDDGPAVGKCFHNRGTGMGWSEFRDALGLKPAPGITITDTAPAPRDGGGSPVLAGPPAHLTRQSRAAWYFAATAGDRVRFDHGRGRWLIWHGHRWRPDEDGRVNRLWLDVLATRYRLALDASDRERVRLTAEVQAAGATNAAIAAGLDIASSMTPIATTADAWDPDPWLLGCENGVVELRTGRLRPGKPEEMISRSTGIAYDHDAGCPRWQRFLAEVFAGDEELVDWYGLLVGTSLVGVAQEILALHHGLGNNGKSVAVRAERHAFGEYAVVIPVETLVNAKRQAGEATPDLMALRGARIAFTSEPDQAAKLRGGTLKRLASVDRMTGRSLYGTTQTWELTHTVHLATNHLPAVDDATDGFWRRVALVPWPVHFRKPGEGGDAPPEDPDLVATLVAEAPGILAWAVRGAIAYAAGRTLHPFPTAVRVRTDAYRDDEDKLGAFVAERVVYQRDAFVTVGDLFAAYRDWCEAESVPPFERLGRKFFANGFVERGHGVERVKDATTERVVFGGACLKLSTNPGDPGDLTPFTEFPREPSESEKSVKYPQVAGIAGKTDGSGAVAAPDPDPPIACRDYRAHQSRHRFTTEGWTCDACRSPDRPELTEEWTA